MSTTAKLFYFSDLPKISKEEMRLNNLFYSRFVFPEKKEQLTMDVGTALQTLLQTTTTFTLDNIALQKTKFYLDSLQNNNCITIITFPPNTGVFFLDMPSEFAKTIVYRVLGKEDSVSGNDPEMTEVEQGIFTFVILKLLSALQASQNKDLGGQFQVIKIGQGSQTLSSHLSDDASLILVNFKVMINQQIYFLRLIVPPELLQSLTASVQNIDRQSTLKLGAKRAFAVQVPIIAEVSQISLHKSDFESLDVDDIIVLETNQVHLKSPGLTGDLHCKIGDQEFGSFKGTLLLTKSGRYAIQVKDLIAAQDLNTKTNH